MAGKNGGARPGAGRPKGSLGKSNRAYKDAIETAFQQIGGQRAFNAWAKKNPDAFYGALMPKLIPIQVKHGGDGEGEPIVHKVTREIVDAPKRED